MTLAHPILLLLLLLLPGMLWLRYRRRRRPALAFTDDRVLGRLPPSWAVLAEGILPVLYGLGILFLVVALARPQKGLQESRVRTEAVDIVLLVDVSTSMRAEDFSTATRRMNRLDAAKVVIQKFVQARKNDRIATVVFAAMPYTISPLTLDHAWLLRRMADIETGMLEDSTAIGDALASAINRLRESKAKSKVVVLLTDGMHNAGTLTPQNAAQAAKALNIKVYTVGAGSDGIVPMPVQDPFGGTRYVRQRSQIDEPTLRHVSETTGAMYFRATDLDGLKNVYEQIDAMEKTEIEVEKFTRFEERFMPFAVLSLICLGLEKLFALTRLGRLP